MSTISHWPELDGSFAKIIRGLFRTRNIIWEQDHHIVAKFGLTWGQFDTLVSLRNTSPPHSLTPTELYQTTQMTSGGLTKILNILTEKALIERAVNKEDKRSRRVLLTDKGCALVEEIINHLIETNKTLLNKALEEAEVKEFSRMLDKILISIDH